MAKLIERNNLDLDAHWYFPDASYYFESRKWVYEWPSKFYPHAVFISKDHLRSTPTLQMQIREWIENNASGTVILDLVDKSYRIYYNKERRWEQSYHRENLWYGFYFSNQESCTLFKLTFPCLVNEAGDLHPDNEDIYEETSYYKKDITSPYD